MERYIVTLLGPLTVLLVSAIFVHASSPSLSLGVMLTTLGAYLIASDCTKLSSSDYQSSGCYISEAKGKYS